MQQIQSGRNPFPSFYILFYCANNVSFFFRNWTEKTDPVKFVFEDIAIASWLISLWELERIEQHTSKLQSFIDLGCGNGLLTFILSSEGYVGFGIDLKKRKIWDKFIEKGAKLIGISFF